MQNQADTTKGLDAIPPNIFSSVPSNRMPFPTLSFAKTAASDRVLRDLIHQLRITAWRLGKLLGMNNPQNANQWFDGRKRPNQLYCLRMIRLLQMALDGQDFTLIDWIDWDEGEVHMKGEEATNAHRKNGTLAGQRAAAKGEGAHGDSMAKFLGQSS